MKLSRLLKPITPLKISAPGAAHPGGPLSADPEITSIHYRSQDVRPGGLFVAICGHAADGHAFIESAIENGASAIVVQRPLQHDCVMVTVENTRKALSKIAARFYGYPSEHLFVIGITGTNGKTTTAYLIESLLSSAGYACGVIGTINYRFGNRTYENPVTTPESLDLHRILFDMRSAGTTHVILEVSSHAIDLFRVADCRFDIGIFTNLSRDHLDYHGDMDTYWACKKRFFTDMLSCGPKSQKAVAVINCEDPKGDELQRHLKVKTVSCGHQRSHTIHPGWIALRPAGIFGKIETPRGALPLDSALTGAHNLENILAAVGVGTLLDIPLDTLARGLKTLSRVPGRLERVGDESGRYIYVDYAHTPDALENVLSALKETAGARIICVFGCGGDRDRGKRPRMGEIAANLSDLAIVTSDNPRTESPATIIAQILDGIRAMLVHEYRPQDLASGFTRKGVVVEPDRRKAIRLAVAASDPGDTILIAGKGHETVQILGKQKVAFDDRIEVKAALAQMIRRGIPCAAGRNG